MKVAVIQPFYSKDHHDADACFDGILAHLDACDDSLDLIVLPEYSDLPTVVPNKQVFDDFVHRYHDRILEKAVQTAIRCQATVFVNAFYNTEEGPRNTTYAIDKAGNVAGKYFKEHPAPSEVKPLEKGGNGIDVAYSYSFHEPYVLELDGLRYGFMTCYDFYFYEAYAALARKNVDIIIGASHQRTDTHQALDIIGRFLSYHTNAYLIRAAVSLGEESPICGCSMVVSPDGTMLLDMKSSIGVGVCTIDPKKKYYKPAGFGGALKAHYEYIEEGRRPWIYRPGGSAIVCNDSLMQYPRICAWGGLAGSIPANTMPAFGGAVALSAQEIGFDLWQTESGELVTQNAGQLPAGYEAMAVTPLEEILAKFSCHVVVNLKVMGCCDPEKITALLDTYDCQKYVYVTLEKEEDAAKFRNAGLPVCLAGTVEEAAAAGAQKVLLSDPAAAEIASAHEKGMRVVCRAEDALEAQHLLEMGADTIVTGQYLQVCSALSERKGTTC